MNRVLIASSLMRYSVIGGYLVLLSMLDGCAVMNTSVMETAEIANPGAVRVGGEIFVGPELGTDSFFENSQQNSVLQIAAVGTSIGLGVTKNLELSGKLWLSSLSGGTRVQAKYRLPSPIAAMQCAVSPGFNFVGSFVVEDQEFSKYKYGLSGADIPIIMSWATDSQAIYLAARYAIDSLTRDDESVTIKRMGVVAGISLKLWKFYIRPELGYETVIGYGSIRTGGLGFGLEDMQLF